MTDPFDALRAPAAPVAPDPAFAAALRDRLRRALLDPPPTSGAPMSLVPYLAVHDARAALEWYGRVFRARPLREPIVMEDGRVGHAELSLGGSPVHLADEFPEIGHVSPRTLGGTSSALTLQVDDVDGVLAGAVEAGARLDRPAADDGYGRRGAVTDPFGHRWTITAAAPRTAAHGDVGYVSVLVPDDERATAFYGAVLGWSFAPGSVPRGWQTEGPVPSVGVAGGAERVEVQLCFRVDDAAAAAAAVRAAGGRAEEPQDKAYGRLVECVDDQGMRFQLWEPAP